MESIEHEMKKDGYREEQIRLTKMMVEELRNDEVC